MLVKQHEIMVDNKSYLADVTIPEPSDLDYFIQIYEKWFDLIELSDEFKCGRVCLSEFSELLFCLVNNCWRCNNIKNISKAYKDFDCYNPLTQKTIEIISTNVKEDITSFDPNLSWDELYFIDFYCDIEFNGSFKIYKIPKKYFQMLITKEEYNQQKKRPITSIKKDIISKYDIKPECSYNLYDLTSSYSKNN